MNENTKNRIFLKNDAAAAHAVADLCRADETRLPNPGQYR